MRFRRLAVVLFIALWLVPVSARAVDCRAYLEKSGATVGKLWRALVVPKNVREFDFDRYVQLRAAYETRSDELLPGGAPRTAEEKLAFIEAATQVEPIFLRDSLFAQRRIGKLLKKIDFQKGFSRAQAGWIVAELYLVSRGSPYSLKRFAKQGSERDLKDIFVRLVEEQMATRGLEQMIAEIGLIREQSRLARLRFALNQDTTKVAIAMSLNLAVAKVAGLTFVPGVRPIRWIKISDAIVETVIARGIDAAWPEIQSRYGAFLKADRAYHLLRSSYNRALSALVVVLLVKTYLQKQEEDEKKADELADKQIEELKELNKALSQQAAADDGKSVRDELFENWKADYRQKHGVEPDPSSADYKAVEQFLKK